MDFAKNLPLQDELVIHRVAHHESILACFFEPVATIKTLSTQILRPHSNVQRCSRLRFQPLKAVLHEAGSEAQVMVLRKNIKLLYLSSGGLAILDGQFAISHRDETDRRRIN